MTTAISTLPGKGAGRKLLTPLVQFLERLAAPKSVALAAATTGQAPQLSIWEIYRLTAGDEFLTQKDAAKLRKQLLG